MNNKALLEVDATRHWMIMPSYARSFRKRAASDYAALANYEKPEKTCGFVTAVDAMGNVYYPEEYQISEDGKQVCGQWALSAHGEDAQDFPFVSVLTVDGPITRNGGGCSYGSIDHRDMMIKAANHPLCRGHIFLINTPGGSAWAKNDYEQAINYARSLGQPVIVFVDGMCASAGMYLASLCDERYYMHPKNEIGCIGVMAAFYTEADGSTNKFTNETYHELYDPESFDKNRAFRDIANDNDSKALVAELAVLGQEFRADVKRACPSATDEHLHGKTFNAEDVKGILMDDQSDFFSCIKRCFALHEGTAEPIKREQSAKSTTASSNNTQQTSSVSTPSPSTGEGRGEGLQNTTIDMTNYPLINAACGLNAGEMVVTEEGTHFDTSLLDALEAKLSAQEQEIADLREAATNHQEAIDAAVAKANEEHTAAVETLNTEHAQAIEDLRTEFGKEKEALNTAHTEAIAKKDEDIATLTSAKAEADEALKGAKEALATAEQTIADKDAQIAELSNDPGNEPEQGAAPQNNGEGAHAPSLREFDPSQYKTCAERKAAFEAFKRGE